MFAGDQFTGSEVDYYWCYIYNIYMCYIYNIYKYIYMYIYSQRWDDPPVPSQLPPQPMNTDAQQKGVWGKN